MKKGILVVAGIAFGFVAAYLISSQAMVVTDCFPLAGDACVRIKLPNGADPGPRCNPGEVFIDTDETDDTNCTTTADNSLCLCTAANTWTALENN